jgi:hypothetical protein
VTKVEFLTNMDRAKEAGVRSIPALVADGRSLTGILLTPARIERFIESLASEASRALQHLLASAVKADASRQRHHEDDDTCRKAPDSRNRPWRFFENVE